MNQHNFCHASLSESSRKDSLVAPAINIQSFRCKAPFSSATEKAAENVSAEHWSYANVRGQGRGARAGSAAAPAHGPAMRGSCNDFPNPNIMLRVSALGKSVAWEHHQASAQIINLIFSWRVLRVSLAGSLGRSQAVRAQVDSDSARRFCLPWLFSQSLGSIQSKLNNTNADNYLLKKKKVNYTLGDEGRIQLTVCLNLGIFNGLK